MRTAAASIGTRLPAKGRPIARTKGDKSSDFGPKVCANAPVSKRRRWNTAKTDERRELMDLKRSHRRRGVRVSGARTRQSQSRQPIGTGHARLGDGKVPPHN